MLHRKALVTLILVVILSACSLRAPTSDSGDQPPVDEQPTATASVEPGPPEFTATFTLPPPAMKPMVSASMDTNCRAGQGSGFEYMGALLAGETAEVLAVEPDGMYYYIQNPDRPGYCWVWGEYIDLIGDLATLPIYTRMPTYTPTPAVAFSYVYNEIVQCVTIYSIELRVTNTGDLPLESFSLYTQNLTLGTDNTYTDYRFADCEACGCGYVDYTITPGESGWLGSSTFLTHYPHGESFHTELTMCSEDGMGGECTTQTLNFTVP